MFMERNIEPPVTFSQGLIVTASHVTIGSMADPKEEFSRRLNEVLDRAGFPPKGKGRQVVLAKRYGVSQKGARKWLEAEAIPGTTRLAEIAMDLGVTTEYLLTGRGSVYFSQKREPGQTKEDRPIFPGQTRPPILETPPDEFVPVKRVHLKLSAGVTGYQIESEGENGRPIFFRQDFLLSKGWDAEKLIALRINGDSMEPGLYDHDVVVINTAETEPMDGEVFAVNYEGEATIKRLKRDSGEWWLASDNPDKRRYPDKKCHEGTILIGHAVYKQSEHI